MSEYLRRYCGLTSLIYLLRQKKLTLLDPEYWDDSNDSHFMNVYKRKLALRSALALCFTAAGERYHYWRVFAGSSSGVCVQFRRSSIARLAHTRPELRMKAVSYVTLSQMNKRKLRVGELPFLKRAAFRDEQEVRLLYHSASIKRQKLDVPISLSCIDKVILSPWLHPDLFDDIRASLRSIRGCRSLPVVRSTLVGNQTWKRFGDAATLKSPPR
jgi:hypothetical protein